MPTSKKSRSKRHTPRKIKTPSILARLSLGPVLVAKFRNYMRNGLLRLYMNGITGKDLTSLGFSFAHAWVLAGSMNECESLRGEIEATVAELGKSLRKSSKMLEEGMYDRLAETIDLSTAIAAESTEEEFEQAGRSLKQDGAVKFMDDFLTDLAAAGLLDNLASE